MGLRGRILGPLWAPKEVKIPVFGHFLKIFPLVAHQSWCTCQFGLLLQVCWILAQEAQFPGHFGPPNRSWFRSFYQTFSSGFTSFSFYMLIGGTSMCISIMCPKGSISGPGVKVAVELVMPSGLLYRKGDLLHYNVIKWKRILRYCPLVGGIHPSTVDSLHKRTVIRTLDVSVLLVWTKCWTNSLLTGDSRRHNGHLTSL